MDEVQLPQGYVQPIRGGSLLFTIQFPEIPGTHFIDLGRMKDSTLQPPSGFKHGTTRLGIQRLNHQAIAPY